MSDDIDAKWLAEQAYEGGNEVVDRYGWAVGPQGTDDGMDQDTVIRMLVSVGWSNGFQAGLKARHDESND